MAYYTWFELPVDSSGFSWGEVEFFNEEHPGNKKTSWWAHRTECCSALILMWPQEEAKSSWLPAAGSSQSSIHSFRPHLHNNSLLCKHWPSVETPCQLLSDSRVPFSKGNAGCDSFNWFLSLQAHLSNLFPFLTPSPSLCGSMTTQHCEVAQLHLSSDTGTVPI